MRFLAEGALYILKKKTSAKMVKRAPKPIEQRLPKWEEKRGFKGVIKWGIIYRKCTECNQPTRTVAETHCPKHGGKQREFQKCQECDNKATRAKRTLCESCWVKADPEARGCPGCQAKPKNQSRADGLCSHCVDKAAFAAKRDAGQVLLAQLCADEVLEEGPSLPTATTPFNTRFVVLNRKDEHKPRVVVRRGDNWHTACAERGCLHTLARSIPGTPSTHCGAHGGGKCAHGRRWENCIECNPNISKSPNHCSRCVGTQLNFDRYISQGGCGMCSTCERDVDAEAAAEAAAKEGKPAPPAAKKLRKQQELKMVQRLVLSGYTESFDKGMAPRPGEFIRELYVDHRCALGREFEYGEKQCAYVDFVVHPKRGGKLVFLEIDEGEHKFPGYAVLCDTTRMWNVCASLTLAFLGDANVLWLRVNPDTQFRLGNAAKHSPSNTARCDAVCALLDTIEGRPDDPPMQVAYVCYQMHADGTPTVLDDPEYHADVKRGVVVVAHAVGTDGSLSLSLRTPNAAKGSE
jgi:predicted amidophosphoribosyltransferase